MDNLKDLVQEYTVKKDRIIKRICVPLEKFLAIPIFSYFRIESDGRFGNLSNYPEELEYYYSEQFYLDYPYLIHPSLLRSGCVYTTVAHNTSSSEKIFNQFQMFNLLIILQQSGECVEGFVFAMKGSDSKIDVDFYPKLEMMHQFIRYFKREARSLIESMMDAGFNLREAKGEAFFHVDTSLPLSNSDPQVLKFLQAISPLSRRERQCLELFKQGNSAQATAAILGLSQRTIEHYFDSIKDKLGCNSKWELLDW